MKKILTLLCVVAFISSCSTTRNQASEKGLHPDQVFTVTEDDIARETWLINNAIKGEWNYSGPSVEISGRNMLAGIGKPITKGKLKRKLKSAYKKIGLTKIKPQFSFNNDGTCAVQLLGHNLKGTYNYNPDQEKITFKWHGVPLTAHLKHSGKKLHLTFDADKLLTLISLTSRLSDNSAIKALAKLVENYDDVMVGFELKK